MTTRERKAAQQQRRRDRARAAGLCIQCCKRPRHESYARCLPCIEHRRKLPSQQPEVIAKRRVEAAAEGRCFTCRARSRREHSRYCEHCGNGHARRSRTWCDECLTGGGHRRDCKVAA